MERKRNAGPPIPDFAALHPGYEPTAESHFTMNDPFDDFIDTAARALELPLEPEWRAAVKANLQVTLRQAALVSEFALPDDAEPAPVFRA